MIHPDSVFPTGDDWLDWKCLKDGTAILEIGQVYIECGTGRLFYRARGSEDEPTPTTTSEILSILTEEIDRMEANSEQ